MNKVLTVAEALLIIALVPGCRSAPQEQRPPETAAETLSGQHGEFPFVLPLKFKGKPFTDLRQHTFTEVGEDTDPAVSPDGKLVAFASTRHSSQPDIYLKPVDGRTVVRKTFEPSAEIQPAFSPDGTQIAFASNLNGNWDIFIVRTHKDTTRRQVTTGDSEDLHPSWSPDGSRLVYCSYSYAQAEWEIWIINLETSGMTNLGYGGLFPQWSPTGDIIAFQRARDRDEQWFDIWTIRSDGSDLTQVVGTGRWGAIGPAWSEDGNRIYFATVPPESQFEGGGLGTGRDIWAADLPTGARIQLISDLTPDWAPASSVDGRVYFCSRRNGFANVWSLLPSM